MRGKKDSAGPRLIVGKPTHRVPNQTRSRQTLEKILDATERLLESNVFEQLTVKEILREAGVSTGSFYARFDSKDDVLRDLYRRYREDLNSLLEDGSLFEDSKGDDLSTVIETILRRILERMEKRRGLIRTVVQHMRHYPDATGSAEQQAALRARDLGVDSILKCRHEISHPRPREAARMIMFTLAAVTREFVLFDYTPHTVQLQLKRERFIRETTSMMANYVH